MDEKIWFYLLLGLVYFLTRGRKKKKEELPTETSTRQPQRKAVSFEDLLREITEQRQEQSEDYHEKRIEAEREEFQPVKSMAAEFENEGRNRQFADDESRRIYEDSIKRAEEIQIDPTPSKGYKSKKLKVTGKSEAEEFSLADEIRQGLRSTDSAKKAIIYAEILNRKY